MATKINFRLSNKNELIDEIESMYANAYPERNWNSIHLDFKKYQILLQPLINQIDSEIKIKNIWAVQMNNGSKMNAHKHSEKSIVYYLKVPPNSGKLHIIDTDQYIEPVEDDFQIIDTDQLHEITEHKNEDPRISLVFRIEND